MKGLIGIISPYKSQVRQIKEKVYKLLKHYCDVYNPQEYVEINTVDAFQGREKDIIIFSCVRSSKERNLGFVSDYRRMNVAITRARHCLYVIGNSQTLNKDKNWRDLILYCKDQTNKGLSKIAYKDYTSKDQQIVNQNFLAKAYSSPVPTRQKVTETFKALQADVSNFNKSQPKDDSAAKPSKDEQGLEGLGGLEKEAVSQAPSDKQKPIVKAKDDNEEGQINTPVSQTQNKSDGE